MDRRKSLKLLATGAIAVPAVLAGCENEEKDISKESAPAEFSLDRNPDEMKNEERIIAMGKFFTEREMTTLTLLADIIIPKDEVSGSASDAGVPDFIDFIVRDMPQYQDPMRGGLRWLDVYCLKQYEKSFQECSEAQRLTVVDAIAYPGNTAPGLEPGVSFFTLMRNLTATGFYTSKIGVEDIGYAGNKTTKWNGVPDEVLQQYQVAYTDKELKECASYDTNKT